jgi:aminoethylphosphonate catabolism LysR family transcriptional regulator
VRVNHQHLRAFHVVAVEGSISRAARRLGVTQPTLSQQLRTLELRHSVALFDGRRQPLELTETGQKLLALTGKLFALADEVEEVLDQAASTKNVLVRLGSDSPIYAARLVAAFVAQNPSATVRVRIGNADEVMAWLRDGQADVIIGSNPQIEDLFAYLPLYRDRLAVALPVSHPLAERTEVPLAELAHETLLLREATSRTRRATEALFETAAITPRRVIEFHTREAIREAIAVGLGVSMFYSAESPPDPRIVTCGISVDHAMPTFTGNLICRAEQRRAAPMRSLFQAAEELAIYSPVPL